MSTAKLMGIILIVAGAILLAYKGFSYNDREKIIDLGPVEATATTRKHVDIPIWVGGVVLIAGVALLATGRQTRQG
jgi:uncharacterized membrane protein